MDKSDLVFRNKVNRWKYFIPEIFDDLHYIGVEIEGMSEIKPGVNPKYKIHKISTNTKYIKSEIHENYNIIDCFDLPDIVVTTINGS